MNLSSSILMKLKRRLRRIKLFLNKLTMSQKKYSKTIFRNTKIPSTTQYKFTMSNIQYKITKHEQTLENTAYNEKKNKLIETDSRMMEMGELVDKY